MHSEYVERVVDLIDPALNRISNISVEEARRRVLANDVEGVRAIDGSFVLLARDGKTVRMARSLDRPMRYFLAKRAEGPALIVADRIDAIYQQLQSEGLADQFHPSYTRMVPAHYIIEIQLVGCPDPDPTYTRFFNPQRNRRKQHGENAPKGKRHQERLCIDHNYHQKHKENHDLKGLCQSVVHTTVNIKQLYQQADLCVLKAGTWLLVHFLRRKKHVKL